MKAAAIPLFLKKTRKDAPHPPLTKPYLPLHCTMTNQRMLNAKTNTSVTEERLSIVQVAAIFL